MRTFITSQSLPRSKQDKENKRNIPILRLLRCKGNLSIQCGFAFLVRLLIDGFELTRINEVQNVESLPHIPTVVNPIVPLLRCWLTTEGNIMYGERRIHLVVYNCCAAAANGTGMD